jgi:hypothetical protein
VLTLVGLAVAFPLGLGSLLPLVRTLIPDDYGRVLVAVVGAILAGRAIWSRRQFFSGVATPIVSTQGLLLGARSDRVRGSNDGLRGVVISVQSVGMLVFIPIMVLRWPTGSAPIGWCW